MTQEEKILIHIRALLAFMKGKRPAWVQTVIFELERIEKILQEEITLSLESQHKARSLSQTSTRLRVIRG